MCWPSARTERGSQRQPATLRLRCRANFDCGTRRHASRWESRWCTSESSLRGLQPGRHEGRQQPRRLAWSAGTAAANTGYGTFVTGKQLGPAADHRERGLSGLAFSPDGTKVATASTNVARLWDAATGQPVGRAMKHDGALTALAFSPGGRKLATAGDDTTARLWDAATGQPAGLPMKHDSKVSFVVFSADGARSQP